MKNMCRSTHKMCEFANANGYCMITACKKDYWQEINWNER